MTKHAEKFLEDENIVQFLRLVKQLPGGGTKSTGPHKVTILRDEIGVNKDWNSGKEVNGLWFYFDENGKEVKYFVPFKNDEGEVHYLLPRLGEYKEGDEIILEFGRRPGSPRGFINVKPASEVEEGEEFVSADEPIERKEPFPDKKKDDEEIPILEND